MGIYCFDPIDPIGDGGEIDDRGIDGGFTDGGLPDAFQDAGDNDSGIHIPDTGPRPDATILDGSTVTPGSGR